MIIEYRIDYRAPGCQEWEEGVDVEETSEDFPESARDVADRFKVYEGHRFGRGEFLAVRLD